MKGLYLYYIIKPNKAGELEFCPEAYWRQSLLVALRLASNLRTIFCGSVIGPKTNLKIVENFVSPRDETYAYLSAAALENVSPENVKYSVRHGAYRLLF